MISLSHPLPTSPMSFLLTGNCYPKFSLIPQHISRSSTKLRGDILVQKERRLKPRRFLRKKNLASQCTCSVAEQQAADTYSYFTQNLSFLLQLSEGLGARSSAGTKQSSSCWWHCLKWEKCPLSHGIHCTCSCYALYPQSLWRCPKHHP